MKKLICIIIFSFLALSFITLMGCSKSPDDKDNIYRDWTKKGERKPAPKLWDEK